jgi:thiosulfate dehydrogenase [quinone] large subunit
MTYIADVYMWTAARFSLGFIFLWAFLDKVFGLGFATPAGLAWINGVSPTNGFLRYGVNGFFATFFHSLAGNVLIDWVFMSGLFGIGLTLILGVATKISGKLGALLMIIVWLAKLPSENNPLIDEHSIYLIVLLGIATSTIRSEDYYGLGKWWKKTSLVKRFPFLA